MSKSGKEIVVEAAKRAAEQCPHAEYPGTCAVCIEHGFAPVAELIEAARHMRLTVSPLLVGKEPCDRLDAALAEVEKHL